MSALRRTILGVGAAVALTVAGLGLPMGASAQDAGPAATDEPVNPTTTTTAAGNALGSSVTVATTTTLAAAGAAGTAAATTTTAAARPATTAAGAAGNPAASTTAAVEAATELPITGSDVGTPIKLGAAIAAVGLGAVLVARRRRPSPAAS